MSKERDDRLDDLLAGVLLQEVAGVANDRVLDTLRTAHLTAEDRPPSSSPISQYSGR